MKLFFDHVTKILNHQLVLDNLNVCFEEGKIYGLQGYNGSGKTMLLRMAAGLLRPSEGKIFIDEQQLGKDIDYPPSMGLMIENPAFLGEFSGIDNLKMIMFLNGHVNEEGVLESLERTGLKKAGKVKFKKYSLGMKQRLGIAAAVMEKPKLILMDEPTNALDAEGVQMVVGILKELKQKNRIIITASHDKGFLNEISDVIYEMDKGQIRQAGE